MAVMVVRCADGGGRLLQDGSGAGKPALVFLSGRLLIGCTRTKGDGTVSYVKHVLQPGEELRYEASIHWINYLHGVLWLLAALIVWMVVPTTWQGSLTLRAAVGVLSIIGLYFVGRAWFDWWITEIAVTNRRVIYKRGFISRETAEMHTDKIVSVKVNQSILGRILNYGKVDIVGPGSGEGAEESLGTIAEPIAAPLELRNHITGV